MNKITQIQKIGVKFYRSNLIRVKKQINYPDSKNRGMKRTKEPNKGKLWWLLPRSSLIA